MLQRKGVSGRVDPMPRTARRHWRAARDDAGVTAIEYALVASLIFLFIVGAVGLLATGVAGMFDDVANSF